MITRRAKYAIKALLYLARKRHDGPVLAGEIAEQGNIPPAYLEQILADLKKKGLVSSRKGRHGGHGLAREPREISLLEVLRATDGPVAPLPCLSRTAHAICDDCGDEVTCGVRALMTGVYEATLASLGSTTLADGVRHQKRLSKEESSARIRGR